MCSEACPTCGRPLLQKSDHHLLPKSRGGTEKLPLCVACHHAIHAQFSNKELEDTYHTVEALLSNERFRKTVAFISKQDPNRRIKTDLAGNQRRRGRNG